MTRFSTSELFNIRETLLHMKSQTDAALNFIAMCSTLIVYTKRTSERNKHVLTWYGHECQQEASPMLHDSCLTWRQVFQERKIFRTAFLVLTETIPMLPIRVSTRGDGDGLTIWILVELCQENAPNCWDIDFLIFDGRFLAGGGAGQGGVIRSLLVLMSIPDILDDIWYVTSSFKVTNTFTAQLLGFMPSNWQ